MNDKNATSDMSGLTIGRIVHFVNPSGEHRPAVIVRVWNKESGYVTLVVFTDAVNDGHWAKGSPTVAETSIQYSNEFRPNTWHWIEPED